MEHSRHSRQTQASQWPDDLLIETLEQSVVKRKADGCEFELLAVVTQRILSWVSTLTPTWFIAKKVSFSSAFRELMLPDPSFWLPKRPLTRGMEARSRKASVFFVIVACFVADKRVRKGHRQREKVSVEEESANDEWASWGHHYEIDAHIFGVTPWRTRVKQLGMTNLHVAAT